MANLKLIAYWRLLNNLLNGEDAALVYCNTLTSTFVLDEELRSDLRYRPQSFRSVRNSVRPGRVTPDKIIVSEQILTG